MVRYCHMSKLIIANWKMNPETLTEAKKIIEIVSKVKNKNTEVVYAPPAIFLHSLQNFFKRKKLIWGAQNTDAMTRGARTGETSVAMLRSSLVSYVIVGHSERRGMGESNMDVALKVSAVLREKMIPVLCVGEKDRDQGGAYLEVLKMQILGSLFGINENLLKNVVIAYEPLWAIGKEENESMDARSLHETVIFIRKVLIDRFGAKGEKTRILYGGSVTDKNARVLVREGEVDGLLVGHHSLVPKDFTKIISEI